MKECFSDKHKTHLKSEIVIVGFKYKVEYKLERPGLLFTIPFRSQYCITVLMEKLSRHQSAHVWLRYNYVNNKIITIIIL